MGDHNDPFMRNQNSAVQGRGKAQGRADVLQLKMIGQSHPTGLTASLLKMFEPRPPLDYKPPPEKRKCPPYSGMAQFVSHFAEPGDPEYAPPVPTVETPAEKKARIHKLRLEKGAEKAAEELKKYDANNDPNVSGDPYKTLFVAKLSYETSESRLKREFESYGPIKRVGISEKPQNGFVHDSVSQKPRGYAFIEYMHTRDMKAAYKQGDGRKIDGRRVLVDVERGRTVPNWRPRRLGGGLGTSRVGVVGEDVSQRNPGREQVQSGAPSRSEEPRAREDRPDREKSRERGRGRGGGDREREKSRERGGGGDREQRDKSRERGGGGGDRELRDKSREHSHERGTTTRDRDHRGEDRHHRDRRERGHDRERAPRDRDHRRHRDRDRDYDIDRYRDYEHSRHSGRDHRGGYEDGEDEGELLYQQQPDHHSGYEHRGRYDYPDNADDARHYDRATSRDMDQD